MRHRRNFWFYYIALSLFRVVFAIVSVINQPWHFRDISLTATHPVSSSIHISWDSGLKKCHLYLLNVWFMPYKYPTYLKWGGAHIIVFTLMTQTFYFWQYILDHTPWAILPHTTNIASTLSLLTHSFIFASIDFHAIIFLPFQKLLLSQKYPAVQTIEMFEIGEKISNYSIKIN